MSKSLRVEITDSIGGGCCVCTVCLRDSWRRIKTGMTESGIGPGAKSYLDRSSDLGPCYPLAKLLMFVFTGLFWILGIVVLSIGIVVHTNADFRTAVSSHIPGANVGASIFIFTGLVMVFTGFIGCLGTMRESRCLLFSFFVILFTIFILLVACGIWADASKAKLRYAIADKLERSVQNYYIDKSSKQIMDSLQTTFQCCGALEGALDYQKSQQPISGSIIPPSCGTKTDQLADACYFKIIEQLDGQLTLIAAIGVTIAILMIFGMVLALTLCWFLQETY